MQLKEFIGHKSQCDYLLRNIHASRLAHGVLLVGIESLGKTTLAHIMARAILCQNRAFAPCDDCPSCAAMSNKVHADFFCFNEESIGNESAIDILRQLRARLYQSAFVGTRKVAIIEQAERLSMGAWSSLLKIVEEPPPETTIFIVVNSLSQLPPTIVSRCQIIRFQPLSDEHVKSAFTSLNFSLSDDVVSEIVHSAAGRPGLAVTLASDKDLWQERQELITIADSLMRATPAQRVLSLKDISEGLAERVRALEFVAILADVIRQSVNSADERQLEALPDVCAAETYLRRNVSPRLVLEWLGTHLK